MREIGPTGLILTGFRCKELIGDSQILQSEWAEKSGKSTVSVKVPQKKAFPCPSFPWCVCVCVRVVSCCFLGVFLFLAGNFPGLFECFLLISRIFKGSEGQANPWCFCGFSFFEKKDQWKEGQGGSGNSFRKLFSILLEDIWCLLPARKCQKNVEVSIFLDKFWRGPFLLQTSTANRRRETMHSVPMWLVVPRCGGATLGVFDLCHFNLLKRGCALSGVFGARCNTHCFCNFGGFFFLKTVPFVRALPHLFRPFVALEVLSVPWG